jgi:5-methylcytosine-specific restriction protein A
MHSKEYNKLINCQRWVKLRREKIRRNPLCEECQKAGIYRDAEEVHHIVPVESFTSIEKMKQLAYDINNLQSLCHDCHIKAHERLKSRSKGAVENRTKHDVQEFKARYL